MERQDRRAWRQDRYRRCPVHYSCKNYSGETPRSSHAWGMAQRARLRNNLVTSTQGGGFAMMRTFASIALAACALALSNGAAAQPRFDSLVIFGTSLSDPGNFFAVLGGNNTPPSYLVDPLLVPSVPYARGGHHFSDGATWVEQLARSLGMAASAKPARANESKKAG